MPLSDLPLELELAVTVLEDETRRSIFDALWRESWQSLDEDDRGLGFEELRQTVGVESSSRLNYHLERMTAADGRTGDTGAAAEYGPERTPALGSTRSPLVVHDDGRYRLDRHLGHRVVQLWALAQPEHEPVGADEPAAVPWDCPYCGRGLVATYRDHRLDCWCDEHGSVYDGTLLPGNAAGHSAADLVRLAALDQTRDRQHLLEGFCMSCWGPVDGEIVSVADGERPIEDAVGDAAELPHRVGEDSYATPAADRVEPLGLERRCGNCDFRWAPGIGVLTCYRPAAAAFLDEHEVAVYAEPMVWRFVEDSGGVRSVDPLRIEVVLAVRDATATFVVDGDCRIVGQA